MKKCLYSLLLSWSTLSGFAAPSGEEILTLVRQNLPTDTIDLTGLLRIKAANGFTKSTLPVTMKLNWGIEPASATYQIGSQQLHINWNGSTPTYTLTEAGAPQPDFNPQATIQGTAVQWADLSFSALWWPNAKFIKEDTKINRACYVVEVPVPNSTHYMRLWIEKQMGMLLEAQTFTQRKARKWSRRVKIESIKKIDNMWVASDLKVDTADSKEKTILEIKDLKRTPRVEQAAEPVETEVAYSPAGSNNQFAIDLYQQLLPTQSGNLIFSPYSLTSALTMTYAGARGATETQLRKTLYLTDQERTHPALAVLCKDLQAAEEKGYIQLAVANSLWPQQNFPLKAAFLETVATHYDALIEPVNYQTAAEEARTHINQWVEENTHHKIKDLIPAGALNAMTRLVLANAIYFKGNWATAFKKEATHPAPFTRLDGTTTNVPMMYVEDAFPIAFTNTFQAIELPYQGHDLSMLIVLPTTADGLPELEKNLSLKLLSSLNFHKHNVAVHLPKWKSESNLESLATPLQALGIKNAFSAQTADFSGMSTAEQLFISDAVHKAYIEVNEEGTEAAAATGLIMRTTSMPPQFTANHPFLYLIRDNHSGAILFLGRIIDPSL